MTKVEEKVEQLVTPPINKIGYEVYDVIYNKEGKEHYLRIYIDNKTGISLEDCEKVNNEITDLLDEADYIKEQYFLEISSPGLERIIRRDKHLKENINQEIFVKMFDKIQEVPQKELTGILKKFDKELITIEIDKKEINIYRKNIALMRKVYKWE